MIDEAIVICWLHRTATASTQHHYLCGMLKIYHFHFHLTHHINFSLRYIFHFFTKMHICNFVCIHLCRMKNAIILPICTQRTLCTAWTLDTHMLCPYANAYTSYACTSRCHGGLCVRACARYRYRKEINDSVAVPRLPSRWESRPPPPPSPYTHRTKYRFRGVSCPSER